MKKSLLDHPVRFDVALAANIRKHLSIQTGTPPEAGRYVIFVRCPASGLQDWTQPHIASYHDNRWAWGASPVLGWIGPLPVASVASIVGSEYTIIEEDFLPINRPELNDAPREELEYDL